jgi:hypothetical protein
MSLLTYRIPERIQWKHIVNCIYHLDSSLLDSLDNREFGLRYVKQRKPLKMNN